MFLILLGKTALFAMFAFLLNAFIPVTLEQNLNANSTTAIIKFVTWGFAPGEPSAPFPSEGTVVSPDKAEEPQRNISLGKGEYRSAGEA